ncbi:MAG: type II toxin-antitoxin system Phd/YefM family antitoxin [bacterium]|nr:type II toxin-antitoxin system Phd/YefM family antitoxin [bacterium]
MYQQVTVAEAASQFSELVDRTRSRGESFVIVRDGEEVGRLVPPERTATLRDLIETVRNGPRPDPGFAEDLRSIQAEQTPLGDGPWDS